MTDTIESITEELANEAPKWREPGHKERMEEILRRRTAHVNPCDIHEYGKTLMSLIESGASVNANAKYSTDFSSIHYIINVAWLVKGQDEATEARRKRMRWAAFLRKRGWAVSVPVTAKSEEEKAFGLEATIRRYV